MPSPPPQHAFRFGIRAKTLLVLLFFTLAGLSISGLVYFEKSQEVARDTAVDHLHTAAQIQAHRVALVRDHYLERLELILGERRLGRALSALEQGDESAASVLREILDDAMAANADLEAMFLFDANGEVLLVDDTTGGRRHPPVEELRGREQELAVVIDRRDYPPGFYIGGPVRLDGKYLGHLVIESDITELRAVTDDYTGLGGTGETILALPSGEEYLALNPRRRGDGRYLTPLEDARGHDVTREDSGARDWLQACVDVPDSNWHVVVRRDRAEVFAALYGLRELMMYAMGLTLLLAIVLSLLFSETLTRPLLRIVRTTQEIATGNYALRLAESRRDEIGDLADAVNAMTESLVRANVELEDRVAVKTSELTEVNRRLGVLNKELELLARHDALTGLYNRRSFDEFLESEWRRAERSQSPLGLILIDVDHFKAFNDTAGHQAGDECLQQVAKLLDQRVQRSGDVLARYGGEEFAVIVPDGDMDSVHAFAEALRRVLLDAAIPHPAAAIDIVTASLGCMSTLPQSGVSPRDLVGKADAALYKAKQSGRNRVVSFAG